MGGAQKSGGQVVLGPLKAFWLREGQPSYDLYSIFSSSPPMCCKLCEDGDYVTVFFLFTALPGAWPMPITYIVKPLINAC